MWKILALVYILLSAGAFIGTVVYLANGELARHAIVDR
jgi:hypothetical protein